MHSPEPLKVTVHPGIGDYSWIQSKLVNCGHPLHLQIVEDAKLHRALPYVEMLPNVAKAEYIGTDDYEALRLCTNANFSDFLKAREEGKRLFISANNWLEQGKRLEEFLPDLDTSFHYEIRTSDQDVEFACKKLPDGEQYLGVYTTAWAGSIRWDGWEVDEWSDFGLRAHRQFPHAIFVMMGADYDRNLSDQVAGRYRAMGLEVINLCGKTTMGQAVELLKRMSCFVAFASGLSVLANVVNVPTVMLYPKKLERLIYAWPDPTTIERSYMGRVWDRPLHIVRDMTVVMG